MGKKKVTKKPLPSDRLTMQLFAPGMTEMHRAGLGGLAATLRLLERNVGEGELEDVDVPGGPWDDEDEPPWDISPHAITIRFGEPERAAVFLERLFVFAFSLDDDMLYLPAQYDGDVPSIIRAMIQQGITLTFLQHGQTRRLAKTSTALSFNPEGKPGQEIVFEYRACSKYKHQLGWKDLIDKKKGTLNPNPIEVAGPMSPGAVVRHNAFSGQTKIEETAELILPLYFSLIGCLTMSINRGSGVLIVPEVKDLTEFMVLRSLMTPRTPRECQITGATDAVLQAMVRLKSDQKASLFALPGCHAITFQPTPWASQQKSRVNAVYVPAGSTQSLGQFETALGCLPPKVVSRVIKETKGRGKNKEAFEREEFFLGGQCCSPACCRQFGSRPSLVSEVCRFDDQN